MPIAHTRALLRAALDGRLNGAPVKRDPNFGLMVPQSCPDVPSEVLDPRGTWSDKDAYDETARELTGRSASLQHLTLNGRVLYQQASAMDVAPSHGVLFAC